MQLHSMKYDDHPRAYHDAWWFCHLEAWCDEEWNHVIWYPFRFLILILCNCTVRITFMMLLWSIMKVISHVLQHVSTRLCYWCFLEMSTGCESNAINILLLFIIKDRFKSSARICWHFEVWRGLLQTSVCVRRFLPHLGSSCQLWLSS